MSVFLSESHIKEAKKLVDKIQANGGLAPLDIKKFWEDEEVAATDPWGKNCPQVPLGIRMGRECFFDEFGIKEEWYRLYHDENYCAELKRKYNDLAEEIVGKRLLSEVKVDPELQWPATKRLNDIFEAENIWHNESYWLQQSADNPDELEALLDRVENRLENLRAFILPDNWEEEKKRIEALGGKANIYRGQRGPITFAMSVYGVENLIYLIYDKPDLAARFSNLILKSMLEIGRIMDEEAGYTRENAPKGFYFCDDNCAMLNADMYEFFGYPILKGIFDHYSPDPEDRRGQHSDSDMGHLLPILGKLNLNIVNFGPNLKFCEIRQHLPEAKICGQLAPFTFSRNEEVNIVAEFLRDFEMAREKKGLIFTTAGSINNGSRLSGMRLIMAAIQTYGRY